MTACAPGRFEHWYRCAVCLRCTCTDHGAEYYMVTDAIWRRHGARGKFDMLCIGCLEERLGRKLTQADFLDVPLNTRNDIQRSARLRARLTSPPGPLTSSR